MSGVKELFKMALLDVAKSGELMRCVGHGWVTKDEAREMVEGLEDMESKYAGVAPLSFIGLLGPFVEHEPVLSSVLVRMVAMEGGDD